MDISIFGYSLYEIIWIFLIYAFLGWCLEVVIAAVQNNRFVNAGFLNGPYCPIYGFGAALAIVLLTPIRYNIVLFFLVAVLLTSLLELATGVGLEKIFHQKWWDYSNMPLNFKGYICLPVSLDWGVACIFVLYCLQPLLNIIINFLENGFGIAVMIMILVVMLVDLVLTLRVLFKIKNKLSILDDLAKRIERVSTVIGSNVADGTTSVMEFGARHSDELEKLRKRYHRVANENVAGLKRLSAAFPHLSDKKFRHIMHSKADVKNTKK